MLSTFQDLGLIRPLLRALDTIDYETPTPIQAQAIPVLLEGRDVLGCAQTGTGKTAAFALPILQHLAEAPPSRGRRVSRALVLSPTRELAAQIGDAFASYYRYLDIRKCVIFGGVSAKPQIKALARGADILVATPGRLLDLMGQGFIDLSDIDFFVLDEADRMLDMGFIHDLRRILAALPEQRQNLLFSATMPDSIATLASQFLHDPVRVEVDTESTVTDRIEQSVMFVQRADKRRLLIDYVQHEDVEQALVFTRTKHGANRLVKYLQKADIRAAAIHGNKSQNARRRALQGFRDGEVAILVATDIASRGLDIDGVSHVFNYDLPNDSESYVHRIGRTARAGRTGISVAFCDETEGKFLRDIEALTGIDLTVVSDHPWHFEEAVPPLRTSKARRTPSGQRKKGGQQSRGKARSGQRRGSNKASGGQRRGNKTRTGQAQGEQSTQSQSRGHQSRSGQGRSSSGQSRGSQGHQGNQSRGNQDRSSQSGPSQGNQSRGGQSRGGQSRGGQNRGGQNRGGQGQQGSQGQGGRRQGGRAQGQSQGGQGGRGGQGQSRGGQGSQGQGRSGPSRKKRGGKRGGGQGSQGRGRSPAS